MTAWLVFQLRGPFASFAETPGNRDRPSAARPSKSAVLGLVAAALGLDRADRPAARALAAGYAFATRTDAPGTMTVDFHTIQSLPRGRGRPARRAEALARPDRLETTLTRRGYRMDVAFRVALAAQPSAPWPLARLRQALRQPAYPLSLGRRSCPPAAPLAPEILQAATARAALDGYRGAPGRAPDGAALYAAETPADLAPAALGDCTPVERRDVLRDRAAGLFDTRIEWLVAARPAAPPPDKAPRAPEEGGRPVS